LPALHCSSGSTPYSSRSTGWPPGQEAQPTAAIVDSQTVKATEAPAPRDYDANKKLTGLKRQAFVDVDGRFLIIGFSTARLHDSVGGAALPKAAKLQCPFLELTWADSVYRGPVVEAASQDRRDSSCRNAAGSWSAASLG
jgi:DDE family transposase